MFCKKILAATCVLAFMSTAFAQTANNPTVINGTDSTGFPIYAPVGNGTNGSVAMPVTVTGGTGSTVTANQGTAASVSGGWPVIAGEPADTTGTFTNATQATAITTPSVDGYETATITISGTYGAATGTFLASDDGGTTYYTLSCARTDTSVVETGYTTLTNTSRAWFCPIHSFDTIRVQSSAVASGTANIRISISSPPTAAGSVVSISSNSTVGVEGADGSTQASTTNPLPVLDAPSNAASVAITPCVAQGVSSLQCGTAAAKNRYVITVTSTADTWLEVFNTTTTPTNGATTAGVASGNMEECVKVPSGTSVSVGGLPIPTRYTVGTYIALSSTACATLTLATTGLIFGLVQ